MIHLCRAVVCGLARDVVLSLRLLWRGGVVVAHGVKVEFSHVVYFVLIERFIHHVLLNVDWPAQGKAFILATFAAVVSAVQ